MKTLRAKISSQSNLRRLFAVPDISGLVKVAFLSNPPTFRYAQGLSPLIRGTNLQSETEQIRGLKPKKPKNY